MNTILQSTRRGKLDAELAKVMKKLAKDKMLRAISDHSYASTQIRAGNDPGGPACRGKETNGFVVP